MSSRALRKLHGGDEIPAADSDSEEVEIPQPVKKNKKNKKSAPANPFDLLQDDQVGDVPEEDGSDKDQLAGAGDAVVENAHKKKKKKKCKKKKAEKAEATDENPAEDEFEAALREVNEMLGEIPGVSVNNNTFNSDAGVTSNMRNLLSVEHRFLLSENEMRRMFGASVLAEVTGTNDRARRGRDRRVRHRRSKLTTPKDSWPPMSSTGLSMDLLESTRGINYFTFSHNVKYQKIQFSFLDAVDSMQPQAIMNVLHLAPYHVDSLLQFSEISRMGEDMDTATDLIERVLYTFECAFHPMFSLTQANCRLDYRRPENRAFYIALFRHTLFVGDKGCYRTALEFCKLILSLDPDGDPLCTLLMLDFYALRASEHDFLIRMGHEWEAHRNLSQLPNFAFSVALAMFHAGDIENADKKLQEALIMFPGLLRVLLDKCNVVPDTRVEKHTFFSHSSITQQPTALKQLISLYVGRCFSCWKIPEVLVWLEKNTHKVLERVDKEDPAIKTAEKKRNSRYKGTPTNIYRHILLSEIKDATAELPAEITASPILQYDPLPPPDSIESYDRPQRLRRAQVAGNPLFSFFRTLMPDFNAQELADEVALEAAGGDQPRETLQESAAAVMNAMREFFANIQPVAPPVENAHNGDEENDGGVQDEEWD